MKKVLWIGLVTICLGQSGYLGTIGFDYSGTENGSFLAEITDSTFSGSSALLTTRDQGTTILMLAVQPLDSISFSALFIYLQTPDTSLSSGEWTLPPTDLLNPDAVFGFFPVIDSTLINQLTALLPDTLSMDSTTFDSTFFQDLITEVMVVITREAYAGISGSINLTTLSPDSMVGYFDINAVQASFPPGTITISNSIIQLSRTTFPQVSVSNEPLMPEFISLKSVYPNPFNPVTTIRFSTIETNLKVTLWIFNATGQRIETLINEKIEVGDHEIRWNASERSSGVYFIQLKSGNFVQSQKVVLIK